METMVNNFQHEGEKQQIATLVFMDLEATGLPSFIGKKNVHVTELSLVAVNRNDFETDESFRVLNKLSLCICPRSQISPGAMSITGLYNDTLETQAQFDESIPKLLKYFFRRLKAPVCLLAHNGNRYDFPLLQAELKRINYALGPEVLCVDTLEALRSIYNQTIMTKEPAIHLTKEIHCLDAPSNQQNLCIESIPSDNDAIDNLLSEDIDLFKSIDLLSNVPSDFNPCIKSSETDNVKSISHQNEHTPQGKSIKILDINQLKLGKRSNPEPTYTPNKQYKSNESPSSIHTEVKRKLFGNDSNLSVNISNAKPKTFSLPKLYHHFFGEDPPISHYAEADCIALSKICQKINEEFLPWIDENSFQFNKVKAMW